jgi:hypothetical protein
MIHTATQIFTHQLLISSDSFFPSPSITLAIFSTIIFLSMFYQVFIICIIQPDQEANLSSYHFFIRKQLQIPPIPTTSIHQHFLSWWDLKPHQFAILYTHIINYLFFTFTRQFITLSNSYILLSSPSIFFIKHINSHGQCSLCRVCRIFYKLFIYLLFIFVHLIELPYIMLHSYILI